MFIKHVMRCIKMASSIFNILNCYGEPCLPLLVCSKVGGERILHTWYKASKTSQYSIYKAIVFHNLVTKRDVKTLSRRSTDCIIFSFWHTTLNVLLLTKTVRNSALSRFCVFVFIMFCVLWILTGYSCFARVKSTRIYNLCAGIDN